MNHLQSSTSTGRVPYSEFLLLGRFRQLGDSASTASQNTACAPIDSAPPGRVRMGPQAFLRQCQPRPYHPTLGIASPSWSHPNVT
jgi:hypothetical protein